LPIHLGSPHPCAIEVELFGDVPKEGVVLSPNPSTDEEFELGVCAPLNPHNSERQRRVAAPVLSGPDSMELSQDLDCGGSEEEE